MTAQRLRLRVSPGGSRTEARGRMADGRLKVRIGAPPEGGRANAALVAWLAGALGVRRDAVRIVSGHGSRDKTVEIETPADRLQRWLEGEAKAR